MAKRKRIPNRYRIADEAAAGACLKKYGLEIPAHKLEKSKSTTIIEMLKDIILGVLSNNTISKLKSNSPKDISLDQSNPNSKALREWLNNSIEKVNTIKSLIEIVKTKLIFEKLLPTELADLGVVKLGDAYLTIHNILYLALDALGNRTTSGKEASIESAKNQRGGVFFQYLIPLFKETQLHEKKVAIENITHYLTSIGREQDIPSILNNLEAYYDGDRKYKTPNIEIGEKIDKLPLEKSSQLINNAFNVAGRLAPGIHIFRETEFRADSKEISDYFSGFLILHEDGITVTVIPNSIGESKFVSVTPDLIPQMIETVSRFSTKTISSESLSSFEKINILWGKSLLTIMQSEVEPPVAQFKDYEDKIKKSAKAKELQVRTLKLTKGEEALKSRKIIEIIINIARDFKIEQDLLSKTKK